MLVVLRPRRVEVRGRSMVPALLPGDRLLVAAVLARPGDIVAVRDPRQPGRVLVKRLTSDAGADGTVVVLGDNGPESTDSRQFGPVARSMLVGVAVYRYAPPARAGRVARGPVRSQQWSTFRSKRFSPPATSTG